MKRIQSHVARRKEGVLDAAATFGPPSPPASTQTLFGQGLEGEREERAGYLVLDGRPPSMLADYPY